MTDTTRPDPDALLARVREEDTRAARARLKIFFGYAPGVGKTYTMLESARRLAAEGVDVAVGVVETHGRAETAALLEGLEVLPRRGIEYRGVIRMEMDLDHILRRRPKVLLVDELAHSNLPGVRHTKRWQDVLEILDAGIDVHTTLNVQHVDSLNDVVAQITFVQVQETVPDHVLDRADEIELVDIPPEELLDRLGDGKVYLPEQARRAADRFFRRGNLLALRELALRRTAERVDADVRAYRKAHEVSTTWPAAERILVCVGPSPSSARLVRAGRRMAAGLRASWIAAYVDGGSLGPADGERLQAHLRMAESLGGEVVRLEGLAVSRQILRLARERNVTRILVGKPSHSRWRDLVRGSLVNELVRGSGEIEVHFVSGDETPREPSLAAPRSGARGGWTGYLLAAVLVAAVTGIGVLLKPYLASPDIVMLYLVAIIAAAFTRGRLPSVAAAALSVLAYDFFFVPPYHTFSVENAKHVLTFVMMFGVGITTGSLVSRLRRGEQTAWVREGRTSALYGLSRDLLTATDAPQAAAIAARHAADVFGGEAIVLLRAATGDLAPLGWSRPGLVLDEPELAVARWAAEHDRPAGVGTDTLSGASVACVPLPSRGATLGVLAFRNVSLDALDRENRRFLEAFLRQVCLAVERANLGEEARAAALRARGEEMRSSLLSAVSHDLRTPLAAITGAGTALRDEGGRLAPAQQVMLVQTICAEAERMERLIANILDMVRIESGGVTPRRDWVPLSEVVGSALERLQARIGGRPVVLDLPDDLPLLSVDPVLMEQVFFNLFDNTLKYTPPEAAIEVRAAPDGQLMEIRVADGGPGVPPGDEERIFEKFHRGARVAAGGAGLGLAICRGIVGSHGGTITAHNRAVGGVELVIRLPLGGAAPRVEPEAV